MQIDKRKIESSLTKKGFIKDETHHTYFYHEYNGKKPEFILILPTDLKVKLVGIHF